MEENAGRISFLTDIEGDWDHLCRFVSISEALSLDAGGSLSLADGWRFVFGGDLVDKAPGSIRCAKALVELKRAYPDRVVLLLGNRDINKMRLTSELHATEIDAVRDLPGPFWVDATKRVPPLEFVKQAAVRAEGVQSIDQVDHTMLERYNTKANRLRWMLKDTMGADREFEFRRAELQLLGGVNEVSDDEVVRSFEASVGVGPDCEGEDWLRQYLELGQLAWLNRNSLFVHGGVVACSGDRASGVTETTCIGHIPGRPVQEVHDRKSMQNWVDELNAWADLQIESWKVAPHWAPESDRTSLERMERGGDALMRYVVPGTGPTCVLSRHVLSDGSRWPVSNKVSQVLTGAGVNRVIVGHTPVGNCPAVIRSTSEVSNPLSTEIDGEGGFAGSGLTVFMCDTSHSNIAKVAGGGQRGKAVCELVVLSDTQTTVHGELETGEKISYVIDGLRGGDSHVGRDLSQQRETMSKAAEAPHSPVYVAARLSEGSGSKAYLLLSPKGRTYKRWLVDSNDVEDSDNAATVAMQNGAKGSQTFEVEADADAPARSPAKRHCCGIN